MEKLTRALHGQLSSSLVLVAMNLRVRLFEKVPDNLCGNLLTGCVGRFDADESKMALIEPMESDDGLFSKLVTVIRELREVYMKGDVDCVSLLAGEIWVFMKWILVGEDRTGSVLQRVVMIQLL